MTDCKFILEFKSTHPIGMVFDGIRFGWIFSLLKEKIIYIIFDVFGHTQANTFVTNFLALLPNNSPVSLVDISLKSLKSSAKLIEKHSKKCNFDPKELSGIFFILLQDTVKMSTGCMIDGKNYPS